VFVGDAGGDAEKVERHSLLSLVGGAMEGWRVSLVSIKKGETIDERRREEKTRNERRRIE